MICYDFDLIQFGCKLLCIMICESDVLLVVVLVGDSVLVIIIGVDGLFYCLLGVVMVIDVQGCCIGSLFLGCIECDVVLYV